MTHTGGTHAVTNQSPAFEDVNLFATDIALREAVEREGGGSATKRLNALGAALGTADAFELGRLANENPPRLRTHDPRGARADRVEFHPSYHALMDRGMAGGLHASVWEHLAGADKDPSAHVVRGAAFYMTAQTEAGHCCPLTMTSAAVPVIAREPALAKSWLPKILARRYDKRVLRFSEKSAVTVGMGMTEKQGGTDVRANTTTAEPIGTERTDRLYRVTGHKWFMSAPMSDAFLVLAQTRPGLSCFLLPRVLPDGRPNALRLMRLKDKLGNRSNASAEVEFDGAEAWLVGEEGRGIAEILDMVTHTRLDCALASAAFMRLAVAQAIHHGRHRHVFGKRLVDEPLMRHVLADLAVEAEAATALAFRLARSFDRSDDPRAAAWRRVMTPVTKYWITKVANGVIAEAMECLGGNGYVEESAMPRLYREAPVNSIWEGSGNVMALDVMRVLQREPDAADVVVEDLERAAGDDPHLKAAFARIRAILFEPRLLETRGRALMELLALTAAGTILRAHAPQVVSDAFVAGRLSSERRMTYGQGLEWCDTAAIVDRALAG